MRLSALMLTAVFSFTVRCEAFQGPPVPGTAPAVLSIADMIKNLDDNVAHQREPEALAMAMQILKTVPVDHEDVGDHEAAWVRARALSALQSFNALDEYERKLRAYYKKEPDNFDYQRMLAEALKGNHQPEALPILERLHDVAPDNIQVAQSLADEYTTLGNDAGLLALMKSVLPKHYEDFATTPAYIDPFRRAHQVPQLVSIYNEFLKQSGRPRSEYIEKTLRDAMPKDSEAEEIESYKLIASEDDRRASWVDRGRLIELLEKRGDKQGVGDQCESLFFGSPSQGGVPGTPVMNFHAAAEMQLDGLWRWDDAMIPYAPGLDVIRAAHRSGQIARLLNRAKFEANANPKDTFLSDLVVMIAVFGHDASAPDLLKAYIKNQTPELPGVEQRYLFLVAVLAELSRWPEGHAMEEPTLKAIQTLWRKYTNHGYVTNERVAELALLIGDKATAQPVLRQTLAERPAFLPSYQMYGQKCHSLMEADMQSDLDALLPSMADPKRTQTGGLGCRVDVLVSVAEEAADRKWNSSAKLAIAIAANEMQEEWFSMKQRKYDYDSSTFQPATVHSLCSLALRLGMSDVTDQVQALLLQPDAWPQPNSNLSLMLEDLVQLRSKMTDHPSSLTPAVWLDAKAGSGLDRTVNWDAAATAPPESGNGSGGICTTAQGLPQLDGSLQIQILTGSTPESLRILKTVSGAPSRGGTSATFEPTDRFLRLICLTAGPAQNIFIGRVVPIALGENLLSDGFVSSKLYGLLDPLNVLPLPLATAASADIQSCVGGVVPNGTYQTSTAPEIWTRLELVGPRQTIVPGITYLQCGWIKGRGNWGVQFLDTKGATISTINTVLPSVTEPWRFAQQTFSTGDPTFPGTGQFPQNAVAFEPVLTFERGSPLSWQSLYIGIRDQKPAPPTPANKTVLMEGLQGITSIRESPQGGVLVGSFGDETIRCIDLKTSQQTSFGLDGKFGHAGVSFVDHGSTLAVTDPNGDVIIRPLTKVQPSRGIFHAPWPIDIMAASADYRSDEPGDSGEEPLIAIGNAAAMTAIVLNASSGKVIRQFNLHLDPDDHGLVDLILSPDGRYLFNTTGPHERIWDVMRGGQLHLANPFLDRAAVGRFFHIAHALRLSYPPGMGWIQLKNGWVIGKDGDSLIYRTYSQLDRPHRLRTGPIAAFCLSTQSNDAYVVDQKGELSRWTLPDLADFPPYAIPHDRDVVRSDASGPELNLAGLSIRAPLKLRGFPGTTLNTPLEIGISDDKHREVSNAVIELKCDLPGATFSNNASAPLSTYQPSLRTKTNRDGEAVLSVHLADKPGRGTITITASTAGFSEVQQVPLEAIDETADVPSPSSLNVDSNSGNGIRVSWTLEDDDTNDATATVIEKKVDAGPWHVIAVVPKETTSFNDAVYDFTRNYRYQVYGTNLSKYGYPPSLPAPPDRLGDFMPIQANPISH